MKTCGVCGFTWTAAEWAAAPSIGRKSAPPAYEDECTCNANGHPLAALHPAECAGHGFEFDMVNCPGKLSNGDTCNATIGRGVPRG